MLAWEKSGSHGMSVMTCDFSVPMPFGNKEASGRGTIFFSLFVGSTVPVFFSLFACWFQWVRVASDCVRSLSLCWSRFEFVSSRE